MSVKKLIQKFIPSFKVRDEVEFDYKRLKNQIESLQKQIDYFENKNEYLFWLSQKRQDEDVADTKKRVFLNMPKATGDLRKLQLAENYILSRVKDICDANNLKFWLSYGTLIGAIRHKGFIPWDDDVDICMLKSDIEKLQVLIDKDEILSMNQYCQSFGKRIYKIKFNFSEAVYIDVFAFNLYDLKDNSQEKWDLIQKAVLKMQDETIKIVSANDPEGLTVKKPIAMPEIDDKITQMQNTIISDLPFYNKGDSLAMDVTEGYRELNASGYFPYDSAFPLSEIEFEGKTYYCLKNCELLLEQIYGDIWSLPYCVNPSHSVEIELYGFKDAIPALQDMGIFDNLE